VKVPLLLWGDLSLCDPHVASDLQFFVPEDYVVSDAHFDLLVVGSEKSSKHSSPSFVLIGCPSSA
jgi:hypothetical protein